MAGYIPCDMSIIITGLVERDFRESEFTYRNLEIDRSVYIT